MERGVHCHDGKRTVRKPKVMFTIPHLFPATSNRVERVTCQKVNDQIERETEEGLASLLLQGPEAINRRLEELDHEWDIERTIEANASSIMIASLALGLLADKRWLAISLAVPSFLLLHALEGWCPPIPILRRCGFRTQREINIERTALRILRGDFNTTSNSGEAVHQAEGRTS